MVKDREQHQGKSRKAMTAARYTCPMREKNITVSEPGYDGYASFRADCPKGGDCHSFPHGRIEADAGFQGSADDPKGRARTRRKIAQAINADCKDEQERVTAFKDAAEEMKRAYEELRRENGEEIPLAQQAKDLLKRKGPMFEV